MPATTITEVIDELQVIITDAIKTNNRSGYFAALYQKVTIRVKEGIQRGEFADNPRMEKLDVLFANRYLDAHYKWQQKLPVSESWKAAFELLDSRSPLLLQHLLTAVNAHINLDLGIAVVEIIGTGDIKDIRGDFYLINAILASMVNKTLLQINRISPMLSLMGLNASNQNSFLIQFTIDEARDGAWAFAEDLQTKTGSPAYQPCIAARDKRISELGTDIGHPTGAPRVLVFFIHLFEWSLPSKIIRAVVASK